MRVLTAKQIRQGHIPTPASFTELANVIRNIITPTPFTIGAALLGSVNYGMQTELSDIDVFWLVENTLDPAVIRTSNTLYLAAKKRYIPLQLIMLSRKEAGTNRHEIRAGFHQHLEYAVQHRGLICGDPLTLITPHQASLYEDCVSYLERKQRHRQQDLSRLRSMEHAEQCHALGKIYSDPLHVARKVTNLLKPGCNYLDASNQFAGAYQTLAPELMEMLRFYQQERASYFSQLQALRTTLPEWTADEYHEIVTGRINHSGYLLLKFLRKNLRLIN